MPNFGEGVPNRGTNEQALDQWNQQMRASPVYQNFMRQRGLPTDGRVRLSRSQQSALEAVLRSSGMQIPSGMHIDQGGNLNQKNRLVRNIGIGAGVAGGGLALAGAAGAGPLSGVMGGGSGAAAGSLAPIEGGAPWAVSPYAGTAAMSGTGAGMGAGMGAAGAAASGAAGGMGRAAGEAAGGLGSALGGMSMQDWLALALAGAGTVGGALSNKPDYTPTTQAADPAMQELLQLMSGRIKKSEPLNDSILAMANGLLPTQYQKGGGGMG